MKYYYKNLDAERQRQRERYWRPEVRSAALLRHQRTKRKALLIMADGGTPKCGYCQETDVSKLELDHINGDGWERRKKKKAIYYKIVREGKPTDTQLQILCEKHNAMKSWLTHQEFVTEVKQLALRFAA